MGTALVDDFEAPTLGALWSASSVGVPVQSGGVLNVSGNAVAIPRTSVDLTNLRQWCDVSSVSTVPGTESMLELRAGSGASLRFRFRPDATGSPMLFAEVVDAFGGVAPVGSTAWSTASMRFVAWRAQAGRVYFERGPSLTAMQPFEVLGRTVDAPTTALQLRAYERTALGSVLLDVDGVPVFDATSAAGRGAVVRDVDGVPALDPAATTGVAVIADVDGTPYLTA